MNFQFNINDYVKVKLTEHGKSILKQQRDELNEFIKRRGGKEFSQLKIDIDEDGYSKFQMHTLINKFGNTMGLTDELPFETDVIITKGKPITEEVSP